MIRTWKQKADSADINAISGVPKQDDFQRDP